MESARGKVFIKYCAIVYCVGLMKDNFLAARLSSLILFAFVFLFSNGILLTHAAGNVNSTNATVASIISNPAVANYIMSNPNVEGYLINNPNAVDAILTDPYMANIDSNASSLIALLGNPSFGAVLGNYSNFTTFIHDPLFTPILQNQAEFQALLQNPSLGVVINNRIGFDTIIISSANVTSDNTEITAFISNPSLGAITYSNLQVSGFLSNPQYAGFVNNPNAVASLLSNPDLSSIISNPSFISLITGSGSASLVGSPQFVAFISNPAFIVFLNDSASAISSNPSQVGSLISNPSLNFITSNPVYLASLLSNPNLTVILNNPSGIAILASNGGFASLAGNEAALTSLLSNPALAGINENPNQMTVFLNSQSLSPILNNPSELAILLGNPYIGSIMTNSSGLGTLLTSTLVAALLLNTTLSQSILGGPALPTIANNPVAFVAILQSSAFSGITNASQLNAFINNPSLGAILANPGVFINSTSTSNSIASTITSNPSEFRVLIANPSLAAIIGNLAGLQSILSNPVVSSAASTNPSVIISLLSNPSLGSMAANPSSINIFLGSPSYSTVTSNPAQLGALLSNPQLTTIVNNPTQFSTLITGTSFAAINTANPAALINLLGNPSLAGIMSNPQLLGGLLTTQSVSPVADNPAQLANLLSNPSLLVILSNPSTLSNLINNNLVAGSVGSAAFSSLLLNPALGSILTNPSQYASLVSVLGSSSAASIINNPIFGSLMSNPAALASLLSNPALPNILANPQSALMFENPAIINSPYAAGILGNPSLSEFLDNPSTSGLLTNPALSGLVGSAGLGSILQNTQGPGILNFAGSVASGSSGIGGVGGSGNCKGAIIAPTGGECMLIATTQIITKPIAGNGEIVPSYSSTAVSSSTPLINGILDKNDYNSGWLITCPNPPNQYDTALYFSAVASKGQFVAGNACLASSAPLLTIVTLTTYITWSEATPAFATQNYAITGIATGITEDLAYSGMTGDANGQNFNLSNGYDSQSYIFGQVPASNQQGLWTWSAEYANLGNANLTQLSSNAILSGLQLTQGSCKFTYDYSVQSAITGINNTNISVPSFNSLAFAQKTFLNVSGYLYAPLKTFGATFSSSCYTNLLNGMECGNWVKISENGSLDLGGAKYGPLNVYIGSTNSGGTPSPDYKESLLAPYPGGYAEANAVGGVNTINVSLVPYLTYGVSIPSAYTQLSTGPIFYNNTYNLYSAHNYVNPYNSLEPFNLTSGAAFLGTYGGYLNVFPGNLLEVDNLDSSSFINPQNNILSTLTPLQVAQITYGNPPVTGYANFGKYIDFKIYNPYYIAASPNGYVYVINYTKDTCPHWWSLCIGTNTKSYLFVMRFIPQGYANLTNDQPGQQPTTQSNANAWNNEWSSYYSNTILEGSQNLYITNVYQMTSTYSSWITGTTSSIGGIIGQLVPTAIATDNNADVFMLGAHLGGILGGGLSGAATSFQLAGVLGNGAKISTTVTQPQVSGMPPFVPSDEFAASPGGQYVYVANASYWNGEIEVYSTSLQNSQNTISPTTPTALTASAPTPSSTSISSGQSVTLTANPSGGSAPYTLQWYTGTASTCTGDSLIVGATSATYTESPTASNTYCYQVMDSAVPPAMVFSAVTSIAVGISSTGTCPNSDSATKLTFDQVAACAQNAGFTGTQLIQIISIAYAESSAVSSATGGGLGGCSGPGAMGILQEGQCHSAGEAYPLSDYNPSTCSVYSSSNPSSWSNIYYDPTCAFQWADAFVTLSTPITQSGCSQSIGDTPYCFWGAYWVQGSYCNFAPTSYSGYDCAQGLNQGNLPWGDIGVSSGGGSSGGKGGGIVPPIAGSGGVVQSTFSYAGNIPLSYSTNAFDMNIVAYLANGGPYDDPVIANAYNGISGVADISSFHHPVSITDSHGILYVVDNWTIYVNNMQSVIMMLRAFAQNGTEIPINPSQINTLVPVQQGPSALGTAPVGFSTSSGNGITQLTGWAPYGWPLSANIAIGSGQYISYCIADCTWDPGSIQASTIPVFNSISYLPIGPRMSATSATTGPWNSLSISSDFNGSIYMIAQPWGYTQSSGVCLGTAGGTVVNLLGSVILSVASAGSSAASTVAQASSYCSPYSIPNAPLYTELLVMHPVIENYTKISLLENTSFACYLNIIPPVYSPCISDPNTQAYLGNIYGPVLGVPSSFPYVESLGNPEQYLNLPNAYSALFPTGLNNSQYSTKAGQEINSGISSPNYGSLATSVSGSGQNNPAVIPNTYIKSNVKGYVVAPYNISLSLGQQYTFTSSQSTGAPGLIATCGTGSSGSPAGLVSGSSPGSSLCTISETGIGATIGSIIGGAICGVETVGTLSVLCSWIGGYIGASLSALINILLACSPPSIGPTYSLNTYYTYGTAQLQQLTGPFSNNAKLNKTIEGGGTYAQYPDQTNYVPNLSDAGLIISPYINYQLFTNRLFGEIYINQTVNPATAQLRTAIKPGFPLVVNATNNYTYSEQQYVQNSKYGIFPAFSVQLASPRIAAVTGVNCGGSCPSNYYYNPSRAYQGGSNITYINNTPTTSQLFQLAELFRLSRYLYSLSLDLSRNPNPSLLGYNRLVYSYVDRFNNTIYMPVDVDFANITQISLNTSAVINPQNTNQTTISVNGIAVYSTPGGPQPVAAGTPIYLYYDANINYLNSTSCPSGTSCIGGNPLGYYKNALLCAFAPQSKYCTIANPLSTVTQPQPVGVQEANTITYHVETNSTGQCAPQPKSLLQLATYSCNIYGTDGKTVLPAAQYDQYADNGNGGYQYCVPTFQNGTGRFTSQLGLIAIAKTDQNGLFSNTFTACGTGINRITAYYYGANAPEPVIVTQSPISESGGQDEFTPFDTVQSPEFNYTLSPNSTTAQVAIGSYALDLGNISIIGIALALGATVLIVALRFNKGRPHKGSAG